MRAINKDLEVIELALHLGIDPAGDTAGSIVNACRKRVDSFLAGEPKPDSIQQVEEILCQALNLTFEDIFQNEDLERVANAYAAEGDPVFRGVVHDFDDQTFAALVRRRRPGPDGRERFVSLIDCRGAKSARRWFSRWHELSHMLTLPPTLEQPVHRSTAAPTAMEKLMDMIAGEVGFYDPIFRPVLDSEIRSSQMLTFGMIDRIRERFCPEASWEATLYACVERANVPALLVMAGFGYTRREEEAFAKESAPSKRPVAKLRVLRSVANQAARQAGVRIPVNMQVPESSCLHELFFQEGLGLLGSEREENLAWWRHSNGTTLCPKEIHVEARSGKSRVVAIISPR